MKKYFYIYIVSLISIAAFEVQAQVCELAEATIVDYGIYQQKSSGKKTSQKEVVTGYNTIIYGKKLIRQTNSIPGSLGLNFGFRYSLKCREKMPGTVLVKIQVHHPSIKNPKTAKAFKVSQWEDDASTSKINIHSGWNFDESWEIVLGVWTIRVIYQDKILAEKIFQIVEK